MAKLLQETAQRAYAEGYEDGQAKKPSRKQELTMSAAHALTLKTNFEKTLKKR